jgi:hypothetical protein
MRPSFPPIFRLSHRAAVASDLLALLAFVTVGLINHKGGVSATGYARDVLPIAGCWLVAAGTFDLYKRPRWRALISTWLAGVTGGDDAVFLAVALTFSLLFVLAFRAVSSVAAPRLA